MSRGELRSLLADNTDLVSGLFATLSAAPPGVSGTIQSTAAAADLGQLAAGGLTPVEKVLALQRVPLFARVAADEMRQLADAAKAVTLQRGAELFTTSAPAALWLVLSGAVVLKGSGPETPPITVRGGEVIGSLEVMSGRSLGLAAEAIEDGLALRLDREDLFSLLSERPELLRQIFSGMFRVDAARLSAF
jgi:signal-transduction protein with cAMP-binding, CBS, and nucleotidyltransferase domain